MKIKGIVNTCEEFLFPDSPCGELPESVRLDMPKNGRPGLQLLLETAGPSVQVKVESTEASAEIYCMKKVPVEYNTGDGQEQGGAMVILKEEKPDYAVRKAPFWVYDCLKPEPEGTVETADGRAAVYLCFALNEGEEAGTKKVRVSIEAAEGVYSLDVELAVYNVQIPDETFAVTNWYSLDAMKLGTGAEAGTPAFWNSVKQHIAAMRRVRQTAFFVQLDARCVKSRDPWEFDFEYLTPEIEAFFDGGIKTLEIGGLLHRGFLPDGMPDMLTGTFKCMAAPEIPVESPEGYAITSRMMQALALYLKRHGWDKDVLLHIHDEPDVHYRDDAALEARRRQYYMAAGIVKKYLPNCRIIEAVKTAKFCGGVDIWVPVTNAYEPMRDEFERMRELGEEVWTYVCCVPEGDWLNRFLDKPVLESRILMWGCEKNQLSGYLHWGWNQFPEGMDPFKATSCHNPTGLGTNFPCGDAFIVYPGDEKNPVWLSLRLEAERRGTEDLELLRRLRKENPEQHDALMSRVFTDNRHFERDANKFADAYRELLATLAE